MKLCTTTLDFDDYASSPAEAVRLFKGTGFKCLDFNFYRMNRPDHPFRGERWMHEIEKAAAKLDIVQDILLEVNIAGEEAKSGFAPEELFAAAEAAREKSHVRVRGIMTIPPFDCDRDTNIQYFDKVRALYVDINAKLFHNELEYLSMGMSGDFEDAIRNGANMVRVGTAIFGRRYYTK